MCLYQKASVPLAILEETLHLGRRWLSVFLFLITKLCKEIVSSLGPVQWILHYRWTMYVFCMSCMLFFPPHTFKIILLLLPPNL